MNGVAHVHRAGSADGAALRYAHRRPTRWTERNPRRPAPAPPGIVRERSPAAPPRTSSARCAECRRAHTEARSSVRTPGASKQSRSASLSLYTTPSSIRCALCVPCGSRAQKAETAAIEFHQPGRVKPAEIDIRCSRGDRVEVEQIASLRSRAIGLESSPHELATIQPELPAFDETLQHGCRRPAVRRIPWT